MDRAIKLIKEGTWLRVVINLVEEMTMEFRIQSEPVWCKGCWCWGSNLYEIIDSVAISLF